MPDYFQPVYDKADEEIGAPWRACIDTDEYGLVFLDPQFADEASCQQLCDAIHATLGVRGADPNV